MTIAEAINQTIAREAATVQAAGMVRVGTLADNLVNGDRDLYLYIGGWGGEMLKIRYVSQDYDVTTDGNGGFGQTWCCDGGTPVYAQK